MKSPQKMLVKELREALEGRGLETSGLKADLLVRLNEAVLADVPAEPVAEPAADEGAEACETAEASAAEPEDAAVVDTEVKPEETATDMAESAQEKEEVTADASTTTAKRPRETSADDKESSLKRAALSAAPGLPVCLKCLIPNRQAGGIIGKGGSVIGGIQKDSGARVQLSQNGIFFPGTQDDRVLMLTAKTLNEVLIGFSLVLAKQYEMCEKEAGKDVSGDATAMAVRLVVPNGSAGVIIGKGGSNIKEIVAKSGARVQLAQKEDMVRGHDERVVTVTGAMEQQLQCTQLCLTKMHEDEATAARAQYVNPGVEYARSQPVQQNMRRAMPMGYPAAQHRMPGMMMHGGRPQPMGRPQRMGAPMGYAPRSPPRGMMPMARNRASPMGPAMNMGGAVTKMTVQVPDGMVGCIIGQAGSVISGIQSMSGARVQISNRGEYFEGTQNRIVTMQGTMQQCQHAQVLIQQAMDAVPAAGRR